MRKNGKSHWTGARDQSTVWDVANASAAGGNVDDGRTLHSTQKPVEVMRRPMLNNSQRGDLVYDPFVGSGTTIIAAETVGRQARCIEIEPAYVDMSIVRWQNFTGKLATHAETGEPFNGRAAA